MKSAITILLVISMLSCNDDKTKDHKENSESTIEMVEGYFPKNNLQFNQPIRIITINNKQDFDQFFGIAKTMTNSVSEIDFEKNKVIAIVARPLDRKQTIHILETKLKNNKLAINYKLEIGEPQSSTSSSLKMFKVAKSVYAIDVYSNDKNEVPKAAN